MMREDMFLRAQQEEKERDREWRERQESKQQAWLERQAAHQRTTIVVSIVAIILSPLVTVLCQRFLKPDSPATPSVSASSQAQDLPVQTLPAKPATP